MERSEDKTIFSGLLGLAASLNPLTSVTFVAATGVLGAAVWVWLKQSGEPSQSFPFYGTIAASYAGGFLIGRIFRRLYKTVAIVAAITLAGLALLSWTHLDTSKAQRAVKAGSGWLEEKSNRAMDYLTHLLPSGLAGGAGMLVGGRRRRSLA